MLLSLVTVAWVPIFYRLGSVLAWLSTQLIQIWMTAKPNLARAWSRFSLHVSWDTFPFKVVFFATCGLLRAQAPCIVVALLPSALPPHYLSPFPALWHHGHVFALRQSSSHHGLVVVVLTAQLAHLLLIACLPIRLACAHMAHRPSQPQWITLHDS